MMCTNVRTYLLFLCFLCVLANEMIKRGGDCEFDRECHGKDVCIGGICSASKNGPNLTRGAVIAIAAGLVLVLAVLFSIAYFCFSRVRAPTVRMKSLPERKGEKSNDTSDSTFIPFQKPRFKTAPGGYPLMTRMSNVNNEGELDINSQDNYLSKARSLP